MQGFGVRYLIRSVRPFGKYYFLSPKYEKKRAKIYRKRYIEAFTIKFNSDLEIKWYQRKNKIFLIIFLNLLSIFWDYPQIK